MAASWIIGEVFVSSAFNVPCMYVLSYETACRAGSYVCTYGAILRIRLTEEYQLVWNKQAGRQQRMFKSRVLFTISLGL